MIFKYSKVIHVHKFLRRHIHVSSALFEDLYSILDVHPKSTQAQIKDAYYKLSKMYHPDINQDVEAVKKFRDVTEAYKILSNLKTKKLYDKGVIQGINQEREKDETPEEKFYKSRDTKHKVPHYGKTAVYDFDQWTQSHYKDIFHTERKHKEHKDFIRKIFKADEDDEKFQPAILLVFFVSLFGIIIYERSKYGISKDPEKKSSE